MAVIVYTSTTCAPCKVAKKRLTAAGVEFTEVALDTDATALAILKSRLGVDVLQTPWFELDGELSNMTGLRDLISQASRG